MIMNLKIHPAPHAAVAEVVSDAVVIRNEQDVIAIMEGLYPSGARQVILHQENLPSEFFDLQTGLAGAILQKFVTYRIQVAIIGDFSAVTSRALKAFIYESNRGEQVFFLESVEKALQKLR